MEFQRAVKQRAKLDFAIVRPSGTGRIYRLKLAPNLGRPNATVRQENDSASKHGGGFRIKVLNRICRSWTKHNAFVQGPQEAWS